MPVVDSDQPDESHQTLEQHVPQDIFRWTAKTLIKLGRCTGFAPIPICWFCHEIAYSKKSVKRPLKNRENNDLTDKWYVSEGRKYCRMLPLEHSAILLTCIKQQLVLTFKLWSNESDRFTQILLYMFVNQSLPALDMCYLVNGRHYQTGTYNCCHLKEKMNKSQLRNLSADLTKGSFGHFRSFLRNQNFKNIEIFKILHVLKTESNCFLHVIQSKTQTVLIKFSETYNVC